MYLKKVGPLHNLPLRTLMEWVPGCLSKYGVYGVNNYLSRILRVYAR